jgi:hypothetical protein
MIYTVYIIFSFFFTESPSRAFVARTQAPLRYGTDSFSQLG